ncbi:hypothetical protein [Mycolicibacterium arenosum]|uniref:hypothetical protein n=1 Tax=Mycolicibacterium arenosum TaxID=2952157 RepID=UPI0020CB762A|nr:hypothetical protein [Mycolicibacterium sp. CAU 1645]
MAADATESSASSSSSTTQTTSASTTTAAAASGPVAEILAARQVNADDFHDMSFGGDKPEDMTESSSMVAFITPSANIACNWSLTDPTGELGINCDAKERTSPPPERPANCELNWATGYVQLHPDGVVENGVCTGGVLTPSIANTLPYDSALVAGDFGCLSAEAGVTCAHIPSGRGFVLSREELRTF